MKVVERPNDLTGHTCRDCGQPIEGIYAEYYGGGQREFGHIGACERPAEAAQCGEAKEISHESD
jgi:hypothetical protein